MHQKYNYKIGIAALAATYVIWGFQSLYWNIIEGIDTGFVMASRIIWAAVCCIIILKCQGKLKLLKNALCDKNIMKKEIPAAVFLAADWLIYLFAVRNGHILECSLGYYIMPVVVFMFGAFIYREKISWRHVVILIIVILGIIKSTDGFGGVPFVTISLALCFAIYSAIKKSLTIDSVVSTSIEILIMLPFAIAAIFIFYMGDVGIAGLTAAKQLYLIGGGIISGLPLVFFSIAVANMPLMAIGIGEYFSPTLGILCGLIMGEGFNDAKLLSFILIWIGIVLYIMNTIYEEKILNNIHN